MSNLNVFGVLQATCQRLGGVRSDTQETHRKTALSKTTSGSMIFPCASFAFVISKEATMDAMTIQKDCSMRCTPGQRLQTHSASAFDCLSVTDNSERDLPPPEPEYIVPRITFLRRQLICRLLIALWTESVRVGEELLVVQHVPRRGQMRLASMQPSGIPNVGEDL